MSKSSAALVGAVGINAMKRGLSPETTARETTSSYSFRTSDAELPSGFINPDSASANTFGSPGKSSGTSGIDNRSRM